MPMRNLNDPERHDGSNFRMDFGGPYSLVVMLNGNELYRGQVGKSHDLYVAYEPMGETEEVL